MDAVYLEHLWFGCQYIDASVFESADCWEGPVHCLPLVCQSGSPTSCFQFPMKKLDFERDYRKPSENQSVSFEEIVSRRSLGFGTASSQRDSTRRKWIFQKQSGNCVYTLRRRISVFSPFKSAIQFGVSADVNFFSFFFFLIVDV